MKKKITSLIVWLLIEQPAKRRSLEELAEQLDKTGVKLEKRFTTAEATQKVQEVLSHIIGIERWGQRRLKVALDKPFINDEHHDYKPKDISWENLKDEFQKTRQETIALAKRLASIQNSQIKVEHNQLGLLSLKGWLRYLNVHATFEGKSIN